MGEINKWTKVLDTKSGLYKCVATSDGKETTATAPCKPDLTGGDIELIVSFCGRFGFSVARICDECRKAESSVLADTMVKDLNVEEARTHGAN